MEYQLVLLCVATVLGCHAFPVFETTTSRIRPIPAFYDWERDRPSVLSVFKRSDYGSGGSDDVSTFYGDVNDHFTGTNQNQAESIATNEKPGLTKENIEGTNGNSDRQRLTNQYVLEKPADSTQRNNMAEENTPTNRIEATTSSANNQPIKHDIKKRTAESESGDGEEDCDEEGKEEQATEEEAADEQATEEEEATDEGVSYDPADNREGSTECAETNSDGDGQDDYQTNPPDGSEESSSTADDQGSAADQPRTDNEDSSDDESGPAGEQSDEGSSEAEFQPQNDATNTVDCPDVQDGGAGDDSGSDAEMESPTNHQNDQESADDGFSAVDCSDDTDREDNYQEGVVEGDNSRQGDEPDDDDGHEGQVTRSVEYQDDDPRANQEATNTDGDEKWVQEDSRAEDGKDTAEEELPAYDDKNTDGRWLGAQLADCDEDASLREKRGIPPPPPVYFVVPPVESTTSDPTTAHPVVIPASVVQQTVQTDSNPAVSSTLVQKSAVLRRVDTPQVPVTSPVQPVPEDLKEGLKQLRQEIQHFERKAAEIKFSPADQVTELALKPVA